MNPVLVQRRRRLRVLQVLILCAALGSAATAWSGNNPFQLGELREGTYQIRDEGIRVRLPAGLGKDVWTREFMDISGQFEVHFGDGQCRRYYLKQIGGPVGSVVAADAEARSNDAVLRAVAGQFVARRGEQLERADWLQTQQGMALLALTTDARGWPCLRAFPAGGQTLGAAWFLVRANRLYEIGYQAGIGPEEPADAAMVAARSEATDFLQCIDLPREGKVEPEFPWRAGDPAPSLAGISLGDPLDTVEDQVGPLQEFDEGEWRLADEKRRLMIVVTAARGAEMVDIGRRQDGDIGGVRVGDRFEDVVRKWGPPAEGGPIMPGTDMCMYYAGEWSVTLTITKGRVDSLSIALGEPHEEPRPMAALRAVMQEPVRTDTLPPEDEMAVGQRFLLSMGKLTNHTGDSVAQQVPGQRSVVVRISSISARSAPAKEHLAKLLLGGPVLLEITSVVESDSGRFVAARLSVDGGDVATRMAQEGWAIVVKSRSVDPRLLAAEAGARANRRGLWGMSPTEFAGQGPDEYDIVSISLALEPEVYVPGE